jgi:hypothetical protein
MQEGRSTTHEKPKRRIVSSFWELIVGFSVVLTIVGFLLEVSGKIDLGKVLILPIYYFLMIDIPVYYGIFFVAGLLTVFLILPKLRYGRKSCILDTVHGRKIALMCQEPRTAEDLRSAYDSWKDKETANAHPNLGFYDYIKLLEKQGFLQYTDGTWRVTLKALHYIDKYHSRE